jgi:spermidine/putrescine transport system substrate-binding protein
MMKPNSAFAPGTDRRRVLQAMAATGLVPVTMTWRGTGAQAAADLLVFDWTGYEIPELHGPYIEKYGASPEVAVYADVYEAFSKVQAGFKVDTVHPNIWDVRQFYDAGLLQPWDTSRLANWPDVFPSLAAMPGAQFDGQQYLIPTDWGVNALIVRSDIVDMSDPSWGILWNPAYAGRISVNTEMEATVQTAALMLGITDPFHASDEEIAAIKAKLEEQRALLRFYWSDPTELEQAIASGEVVAAWAWPQVYGDLVKEGQPVAYLNPKEGVYSWMTGFVRMADGPGLDQNAYDYVDAWLSPETGKWLIENYGYGHTNRKSFELVSAEVLEEKGLGSPDEVLGAAHAVQEYDVEVREKLVNMFEEVKAGF